MATESEISPAKAAAKLAEGAQLVDVRRDEEWEGARLTGARHIPLDQLTGRAEEIDPELPVIFYCHSGSRSEMASQAFRASGYDAYNLTGGIQAWQADGLEVEPPGAQIVH